MSAVYPLLLMGRFLQGVGIAAPAILSFLVIADAYPLKRQKMLEMAGVIYLLSLASLLGVLFLHGHSALWITLGFLPFIVSQIIPGNLSSYRLN